MTEIFIPPSICPDCKNELEYYEIEDLELYLRKILVCFKCGYFNNEGKILHGNEILKLIDTPEIKWLCRIAEKQFSMGIKNAKM